MVLKHYFLLAIVLFALVVPVGADLTIVPTDKGTTYITWEWDNPSNISEMYIDGNIICGYETTFPSVTAVGFRFGSCHNISLFSDVGNGTNISCTNWGNVSKGGGTTVGNTDFVSQDSVLYALVGGALGAIVILGLVMRRRR